MYIQEIAESLQQVKHKGGSRPPIRTLEMGDVTEDYGIFATCNPFQGFNECECPYVVHYTLHVAKIPQSPVQWNLRTSVTIPVLVVFPLLKHYSK